MISIFKKIAKWFNWSSEIIEEEAAKHVYSHLKNKKTIYIPGQYYNPSILGYEILTSHQFKVALAHPGGLNDIIVIMCDRCDIQYIIDSEANVIKKYCLNHGDWKYVGRHEEKEYIISCTEHDIRGILE